MSFTDEGTSFLIVRILVSGSAGISLGRSLKLGHTADSLDTSSSNL